MARTPRGCPGAAERGITVVQSTTPEPGEFNQYFQHDVDRLWEVVATRARPAAVPREFADPLTLKVRKNVRVRLQTRSDVEEMGHHARESFRLAVGSFKAPSCTI
jgi:hypothetical protein